MKSIKDIRAATGLSQAKFSEKYQIPKRTIEDWETGKRKPPDYVTRFIQIVVEQDMNKKETSS